VCGVCGVCEWRVVCVCGVRCVCGVWCMYEVCVCGMWWCVLCVCVACGVSV
jgi:hypothetical protein